MAKGSSTNCDVCRSLYGGRCAREEDIVIKGKLVECDLPVLLPENNKALELWQILSKFDRAAGFSGLESVSSESARNLCFDYDETWEIYEKILHIEGEFITKWREEQKNKEDNKSKQEAEHKGRQKKPVKKRRRR